MTAPSPRYLRLLADDLVHTVDNDFEFAPDNVVAALRDAADEHERLLKAVHAAPHETGCGATIPMHFHKPWPCTCWKSDAVTDFHVTCTTRLMDGNRTSEVRK